MKSVKILNSRFDIVTQNQAVDAIFSNLNIGRFGWISTVNVSILMMMRDSDFLQKYVDTSLLVVADGQPIVWISRMFGSKLPERVTGVDLIEDICRKAQDNNKKIFFLGASKSVVKSLSDYVSLNYPKLDFEYSDGYFDESESGDVALNIKNSNSDILVVAMGVPKQERFIAEHWSELGVKTAIGVGGSFDVLAGIRKRAPVLIQKIGFEWLYRLIQEPRRLFSRYMKTNTKFIFLVLVSMFNRFKTR